MSKKEFKPGGFLGNILLKIDNGELSYRSAYGAKFSVSIDDITAVSSTSAGFGKSVLIITGAGSELARSESMPSSWTDKSIEWIKSEIDFKNKKNTTAGSSEDPLVVLEKLKALLDKNLITQSDYDAKKEEVLLRL